MTKMLERREDPVADGFTPEEWFLGPAVDVKSLVFNGLNALTRTENR